MSEAQPVEGEESHILGRGGKSWVSISILIFILGVGAFLRMDNITKEDLWRDEYWTLCLATGGGDSVAHMPQNQIIEHPPDVGFAAAPAWWHIWNGIKTTSHPPLYHIVLRFWVDLMGDSDRSIRGLSAVFSLGCVMLMYGAVTQSGGERVQGLIAAALMALAPVQIYYSQQVRPYTMVELISLATAMVVIGIKGKGATWFRLILLGLGVIALALTHYFAAGVVGALALYSMMEFRLGRRLAVVLAIVLGAGIAAMAWGPHLRDYSVEGYGKIPGRNLVHLALSVPQRLTMEGNQDPLVMADDGSWALVIALAAVTYVFPVLVMRKRRELLLWWLWVGCGVGLVLAIDLWRNSTLLTSTRYVLLAAPGVYAILAAPLGGRIGRVVPWAILGGVAIFALGYWQAGPPTSPDVKIISGLVRREVLPGDMVIVTGNYYFAGDEEPAMTYFAIAHYGGAWNRPVVLGTAAIQPEVQLQMLRYRRIWVVGISPESDTKKILPGWEVHDVHGPGAGNLLWYVTPGRLGRS